MPLDFTRSTRQPSARRLERYHRRLRSTRRSPAFWIAYVCIVPILALVFRVRRVGGAYVPAAGRAILTANHCSFSDPFFLALLRRRRLFFIAKAELMGNPVVGAILVRMGAIPIRRGASDSEAMKTAELLLNRGELVGIFPEGTRVNGRSVKPRHGAARLALATNAPIIPCGVVGTEDAHEMRFGHRIGITALPPLAPESDASELTERLWRAVGDARSEAAALARR